MLIVQKVNKTRLKTLYLCDTNSYCIHNMFQYTKSSEVNPQKNKHMKMAPTFSLLFDSIPRHKREKLWLL